MPINPANPAVDLSSLPAPNVVVVPSFEQIRADRLADLRGRWPAFDALLESDPAVKLQETSAYREMLAYARINDAARAVMLPFATGGDLDNLGAFYGVLRRTITPAAVGVAAEVESDAEFRLRIQLAPKTLPHAGVTAAFYRARALEVSAELKDVKAIRRGGGKVDVVLLGRTGDGTVPAEIVGAVYRAFQEEDATQLTDDVSVRAATILPYSPTITLRVRYGPDFEVIREAAEKAVRDYAARRHRVGEIVYAQMLEAAAGVGGVELAKVDIADVDPGAAGAAYLAGLAIERDPLT